MQRKEFLKSCTMGVCSCFAVKALIPESAWGQEQGENTELENVKKQMAFVHKRFASLISLMNTGIDPEKRAEMFEQLGRICSFEFKDTYMKYKDNVEGFLNEVVGKWVENVSYDKENQTIMITGSKMDDCYCPLAKKTVTPVEFCECSLGWQKGVYEGISGKKAEVTVIESVLRGGERCSFEIRMA